jgi:two-component system, LytTR family, sensor kinase
MLLHFFRKPFAFNAATYLPYLYPILMPILTLYAFKIPTHSVQESLQYWLFTSFIQFVQLLIVQRVIYLKKYNQYIRWLLAFVIAIIVVFIYLFVEYNFWHITAAFAIPNKWVSVIRYCFNTPILIALLESIKSSEERKQIMMDNISLANENTKAQYNLLLQQINPHFLFNCLTVLQSMVRTKDPRTDAFITQFADVYHQSMKTEKDTVTLREELSFLNAYMYLMCMRQEDAVTITIEIADASLDRYLPTFALQLLVENCIKHNIASIANPLHIRLYQRDAHSLTIANNYQPKPQPSESFGIGIPNLQKRYALEGVLEGLVIKQTAKTYETTLKLL